jgi:predicted transposase YdaD
VKRDSIYYQIFKRFPGLLFELVDYHPEQAQNYRFESVEVKETAFRIDGVFLPLEGVMLSQISQNNHRARSSQDYHREKTYTSSEHRTLPQMHSA